jgi:hypothetical protein
MILHSIYILRDFTNFNEIFWYSNYALKIQMFSSQYIHLYNYENNK